MFGRRHVFTEAAIAECERRDHAWSWRRAWGGLAFQECTRCGESRPLVDVAALAHVDELVIRAPQDVGDGECALARVDSIGPGELQRALPRDASPAGPIDFGGAPEPAKYSSKAERDAAIVAARKGGRQLVELAAEFNLSEQALSKICTAAGVRGVRVLRDPRWPNARVAP